MRDYDQCSEESMNYNIIRNKIKKKKKQEKNIETHTGRKYSQTEYLLVFHESVNYAKISTIRSNPGLVFRPRRSPPAGHGKNKRRIRARFTDDKRRYAGLPNIVVKKKKIV